LQGTNKQQQQQQQHWLKMAASACPARWLLQQLFGGSSWVDACCWLLLYLTCLSHSINASYLLACLVPV
jgi:hypothetical protein